MESYSVTIQMKAIESVDEILKCDHLNESY